VISQLLLAGQVLVLVLLYLVVWRVVRGARLDLQRGASPGLGRVRGGATADESTIIPVADAVRARREAGLPEPRIVVVESSVLTVGVPFVIGPGLTLGRGADNDIVLDDGYVSTHHARLVPPSTLVDLASTNGSLVNGAALVGRVRLHPGDEFQLGTTRFRYEVPT
jgi:hypothetical protein